MYVPTTQTPDFQANVLKPFTNAEFKAVAMPETLIHPKLWQARPTDILMHGSMTRLPDAPFAKFDHGMVLVPFWDHMKLISNNQRLTEEIVRLRDANKNMMADSNIIRSLSSKQQFEINLVKEEIKFMLGLLEETKETIFHLEERMNKFTKPQ